MTGKEKRAFRQTAEWKAFRQRIIDDRGNFCQCCGAKAAHPQLHHHTPEAYDDLDPEKFSLLCKFCHEQVSRIERVKPERRKDKFFPDFVEFYEAFLR